MCIPIQVLVNLESQKVKVSYSFYGRVIYSDVRNELINFSLTMMENHIFSFNKSQVLVLHSQFAQEWSQRTLESSPIN